MRSKILKLIENKPKHYVRVIKKDHVLLDWVRSNYLIQSDNLPEIIYSALHQVTNICPRGNIKPFNRISSGFRFCGHSSKCICNKNASAEKTSNTKQNYTISQHTSINKRRADTMKSKYGVAYNSQRAEFSPYQRLSDDVLNKLNNKKWLYEEYVTKKRNLTDIADELNIYYGTVCWYCKKFNFKIRRRTNYSKIETEIAKFIMSLNIGIIQSDWNTLEKQEIDILVPTHNIGIEVNGLYWHSWHDTMSDSNHTNKHLYKSIKAKEKNIDLIHITDYDWINHQDIIKSIIKSKLGCNQRIFARNCQLLKVNKNEEREFIDKYHLQGYIPSSNNVGLYHDNELISIMTIGNSRFNVHFKHELLRYCSKSNITVVGGGSKMIKNLNTELISYCSRDMSNGSGYIHMGFDLIGESNPGFFWTDGTNIISRYKAQKQNLKKWLPNYKPELSQSKNMFSNGYRQYWNCGNLVFAYQP